MLVLVTGLSAVRPAIAAGNTYYVSLGGQDSWDGTTISTPFRTVTKGLRALHPGDTLLVRGGTYVERITGVVYRAGTAANPIRVANYPGERPVIKGLLAIRSAHYWTFDGINVAWDSTTGSAGEMLVKIMDGVGWTFKRGEIWGAKSYAGLYIGSTTAGQPASWTVADNCVHDTVAAHAPFQDHNMYIATRSDSGPGLVERNIFYNASNGENVKVGAGSGGQASRVTIRYNTLYNAAQNALVAEASHHIVFERNIMGRATGKWWYPNLRGYKVTGGANVARNNLGFAAARFLLNTDSKTGIGDGGGNVFPRDPRFDAVRCSAFRPLDYRARMYGRWAPWGAPVAGDWDGDGDETPGITRANGKYLTWYLNNGFDGEVETVLGYGLASDRPVVGDWDDDGEDTPGIVRPSGKYLTWYLNNGLDGTPEIILGYGLATDRPVAGDWDGDGDVTPGIVRANGKYLAWYLNNGFDGTADITFTYGLASDTPFAGDWDDDGQATPAVLRGATYYGWYLNNGFEGTADVSFGYGHASHLPVVGDWDGGGETTIGTVFGNDWLLRNSNTEGGTPDIVFSDADWL